MSTTPSTKPTQSLDDAPTARLNESTAAKEVRAHEHARHRTKERQEHALAKERKDKIAVVRMMGIKVTRRAKPFRRRSMESWDGEEPEEQQSVSVAPAEDGVLGALLKGHGQGHDVSPPRDSTRPFTELTLSDLISRSRQPKLKQLDFEVIPPIRAVIVLDDAEADEPWEYITRASVNDGSAWKGKSYAQALASAM